jgi:hypothetical protein
MELLARDFLVAVVEGIDGDDSRDIAMRKLCFDEIVRRGELSVVASIALRVYTLDKEGFYGKSIRCEAMEELATRTGKLTDSSGSVELQEEPLKTTELGI